MTHETPSHPIIGNDRATILVVDDNPDIVEILSEMLTEHGYQVRPATNAGVALQSALSDPPNLILLDIKMPDMDGITLCKKLKADPCTSAVPVIFISVIYDTGKKLKAFAAGGVDYISKPFHRAEVLARVRTHLNLYRLQTGHERLVQERTEELTRVNQALEKEIAGRMEAEGKIRCEKDKLLNILDSMEDGVYIAGRDYDIEYINPAFIKELGPVEGRKCYQYFNDRTSPCPWCKNQEVFAGETVGWEWHSKKRRKTFDILYTQLKNIDGSISKLAIFRDITERKKSEIFIASILESIGEGLTVTDSDYRIVTANRSYCEQMKAPLEQITGRHCYEVSHHINRPCYEVGEECAVKKTFATGRPQTAMHTHYDKDNNPVYIETKSYPMKEDGRVVSVIETINDITEQKKLEKQLQQAQKMEAVGQLAGGVAHDFNNILAAIINYGHLMLMKPVNEEQHQIMEKILFSADRAAKLTSSLLAFSRKQVMQPVSIRVNELIERMEKLISRVIGENIEIRTILSDKDPVIMADSTQIEQVLLNLATNARDAMPEGGELTLATEEMEMDEAYRTIHGYGEPGRYAVLSLSDTGQGMDQETLKKIFEPFFTTKEVGRGTGLGLSMSYGIIKQHNGFINVYSEPGQGTTVKIYLPVAEEEQETATAPLAVAATKGKETLLLAEDDVELREVTRQLLEASGYQVIEAADGEEAVAKFRENRDRIDLLILDAIMPNKSGKEAYDEIRAEQPDIKALFLSGYSADTVVRNGFLEQGLNFISKPVAPSELMKKIREILGN